MIGWGAALFVEMQSLDLSEGSSVDGVGCFR